MQSYAGAYVVCELTDLLSAQTGYLYTGTAEKYKKPVEGLFNAVAGNFSARGKYKVEGHAWDFPYTSEISAEVVNQAGQTLISVEGPAEFDISVFENGAKVAKFECMVK